MNEKQFLALIRSKRRQLAELVQHRMPVLAGNIAKRHIDDDFRQGGFTNGGFHKWKETGRQKSGSGRASSKYGPLLSGRNHLMGSTAYRTGIGQVNVYNDTPYAGIHNRGGVTHPAVTPKMRRFAWAMYYKTAGIKRSMKHGGKARKRRVAEASREALQWKRLALTKKARLTVRIPRRQFMPDRPGPELTAKVQRKLEEEARKSLYS